MAKIFELLRVVLRFHKKKILFFLASTVFCLVVLFPYDDLSELLTQQISIATGNSVYVQFDDLSFGLFPQLGLMMSDVIVESVYAPTLSMKALGFAPSLTSLIFNKPGGKIKAYGVFDGDATVSLGRSNELDIDTTEYGLDIELADLELKQLTKFLKSSYDIPFVASGQSSIDGKIHVDPTFKEQPKGDINIKVQKMNIPSTILPLGGYMSYSLPALKLSQLNIAGKIDDRKFIIKEGKIGDPKNDLHGDVTGEFVIDILPGGQVKMGGYDLKINLNVSDNLKRQLETVLSLVDLYQGIGEKYKFDSLKGVRYSFRLSARSMTDSPRVLGN